MTTDFLYMSFRIETIGKNPEELESLQQEMCEVISSVARRHTTNLLGGQTAVFENQETTACISDGIPTTAQQ